MSNFVVCSVDKSHTKKQETISVLYNAKYYQLQLQEVHLSLTNNVIIVHASRGFCTRVHLLLLILRPTMSMSIY